MMVDFGNATWFLIVDGAEYELPPVTPSTQLHLRRGPA